MSVWANRPAGAERRSRRAPTPNSEARPRLLHEVVDVAFQRDVFVRPLRRTRSLRWCRFRLRRSRVPPADRGRIPEALRSCRILLLCTAAPRTGLVARPGATSVRMWLDDACRYRFAEACPVLVILKSVTPNGHVAAGLREALRQRFRFVRFLGEAVRARGFPRRRFRADFAVRRDEFFDADGGLRRRGGATATSTPTSSARNEKRTQDLIPTSLVESEALSDPYGLL